MNRFILILILFSSIVFPSIRYEISNHRINQGQVSKLYLYSKQPISGHFRLNKQRFRVYPLSRFGRDTTQYIAYIAIHRWMKPGAYQLHADIRNELGEIQSLTIPIKVKDAGFKKEHITLAPKKNKLVKGKKSLRAENSRIAQSYKRSEPHKMFVKPFILPVKNSRVTSTFGNMRVYNGVPSWSHSGLDLGKRLGVPILASNRGRVALVGEFRVHGKTVIIDHGWNIFTIYNHLKTIFVQHNQVVTRGQTIGRMGATGVATGPHLHWGFSVQGVRVNPSQWVDQPYLIH